MLGSPDDSQFEHYQIDDFRIARFPAAAHVYIRYPTTMTYTLFCSFGIIAAAEALVTVLREKGDVDAYMVDLSLEN